MNDQAPLAALRSVIAPVTEPLALDNVDLRLLRLLAGDSRRSQRALARELGMSAPAVAERLGRLERTGVVRSYTVDIDWPAAGWPVTVYLAINAVQGSDLSKVIDGLRAVPEVSGITVVTGNPDLLARVVARDHSHLRNLLLDHIWTIEGVQRTETYLALIDLQQVHFAEQLIATATATDLHPRSEESTS